MNATSESQAALMRTTPTPIREAAQGATKVLDHFEAERGDLRQPQVLTGVDDLLQRSREREVVVDVLVGHGR
jgi:hypothetical protein